MSRKAFSLVSNSEATPENLWEKQLIKAARIANAERVTALLQQPRLDVNYQDDRGMTALHHGALMGARPVIVALVTSRLCNYLLKDLNGRYAWEYAIESARDFAVARLLLKHQIRQAHRENVPAYMVNEPRKNFE